MNTIEKITCKELKDLFIKYWEGDYLVIKEEVIRPESLDGFLLKDEKGQVLAFASYRVFDEYLEIVSLNSLESGRGYGSKLIKALLNTANSLDKSYVRVTTTNDNTDALRFYQKFGFSIFEIDFGAVDRARKIKDTIPLYDNQIRIEHEISLQVKLGAFR